MRSFRRRINSTCSNLARTFSKDVDRICIFYLCHLENIIEFLAFALAVWNLSCNREPKITPAFYISIDKNGWIASASMQTDHTSESSTVAPPNLSTRLAELRTNFEATRYMATQEQSTTRTKSLSSQMFDQIDQSLRLPCVLTTTSTPQYRVTPCLPSRQVNPAEHDTGQHDTNQHDDFQRMRTVESASKFPFPIPDVFTATCPNPTPAYLEYLSI